MHLPRPTVTISWIPIDHDERVADLLRHPTGGTDGFLFLFIGSRSKGRNPFVSTGLRSFFRSTSTGPTSRLSACLLTFLFVLWRKKELFRYPGVRGYLRLLGGIPFDRERPIKTLTSVKDLFSRLKASEKIVVFPEGTYVRGVIGAGKSRLIQTILGFQPELKERIPFVPMGIRYRERAGWRRRVDIRIGHPLFADKGSDAVPLTRQVMSEIARLSGLPMNQPHSASAKRIAHRLRLVFGSALLHAPCSLRVYGILRGGYYAET